MKKLVNLLVYSLTMSMSESCTYCAQSSELYSFILKMLQYQEHSISVCTVTVFYRESNLQKIGKVSGNVFLNQKEGYNFD